jgi:hypothetical protein
MMNHGCVAHMMEALKRAIPIPQFEIVVHVLFGGGSFASTFRRHPVHSPQKIALRTSRLFADRLRPPRLAGANQRPKRNPKPIDRLKFFPDRLFDRPRDLAAN